MLPLPAVDLGGAGDRRRPRALRVSGCGQFDEVLFGHVIQAGAGQITARQAAVRGGIPMTVPATTINKVCLSGMTAIALADKDIRLGEATFVVAGGMESMSNAPYLLPDGPLGSPHRRRHPDRHHEPRRSVVRLRPLHDGRVVRPQEPRRWASAAPGAGRVGGREPSPRRRRHGVGALRRRDRPGAGAAAQGRPGVVDRRRGHPARLHRRVAGPAPARLHLRRDRSPPGNASQISDGAAAVVVADDAGGRRRRPADRWRRSWRTARSAGPTPHCTSVPPRPCSIALKRAGMAPSDLDLVEINEAFAAVALWSARMLDIPHDRVNVNGGAVALGHPLGATGARIVVTLINALRRRGGGVGAAALCGGGGQGDALIVEVRRVTDARSQSRPGTRPGHRGRGDGRRPPAGPRRQGGRRPGRGGRDAQRSCRTIDMDGIVVIGEGEKDDAPMLYNGERVGNGEPPLVDVAVDPVDGTRLTAEGKPGALAVMALAARGLDVRPREPGLHGQDRRRRGGRAGPSTSTPRSRTTCAAWRAATGQGRRRPHRDHPRPPPQSTATSTRCAGPGPGSA